MTRYSAVFGICLFVVPTFAHAFPRAQEPAPDLIDGAATPDRIPDLVAYRLYLITVSETSEASPEAKKRQMAHLSKLGLSESDLSSIVAVLAKFKKNYTSLIEQYNETAQAAEKEGKTADYQTFLLRRDALVQSTRQDLRTILSADGSASLDALVKHEKRYMKIGVQEAQQ